MPYIWYNSVMKNIQEITSLELTIRDGILWPIAKPFGVLYDVVWDFAISKLFRILIFVLSPIDQKKKIAKYLDPAFLKKEIFTIANLMTFYGVFLLGELVVTIWKWLHGIHSIHIISLSSFFLNVNQPSLLLISFLTLEVFLTDMIDGPLARWNNAVSALGTFADHTRDYIAGMIALVFSMTLTWRFNDTNLFLLELSMLIGFGCLWYIHMRLGILEKLIYVSEARGAGTYNAESKIEFLKKFLTERYQNNVLGRVQFAALGISIIACLFYYSTESVFFHWLFVAGLFVGLGLTYYYLSFKISEYWKKKAVLFGAPRQSY